MKEFFWQWLLQGSHLTSANNSTDHINKEVEIENPNYRAILSSLDDPIN